MRSASIQFLRGFVLLATTLLLPWVAIFGPRWPPEVGWVRDALELLPKPPPQVKPRANPQPRESTDDPPASPSPLDSHAPGELGPPIYLPPSQEAPTRQPAEVPPAPDGLELPEDSALHNVAAGDKEPPAPPAERPGSLNFRVLEAQVKQAGALYYRLETLGREGLFRFQCRVAVPQSSGHTRHFEAVAKDPLTAMQRVLEKIHTWRR